MGRKSEREPRRKEILQAFAKVLSNHGYAGATVQAVAAEAGLSPGLLHHHFRNKQEMLEELFGHLVELFRARLDQQENQDVGAYINAALKLDRGSDLGSARCWVGIFAEALREPALFEKLKRYLEREIGTLSSLSKKRLSEHESSALLAYILGALVFGAFAPRKTAGFAAPGAEIFARALLSPKSSI